MGSVNSTTIKNSIDNKNRVINEDFIKSCSDILNEDNTEISKNIITKHITTTAATAEMNLGNITADGKNSKIDLKNMVVVEVNLESSDVQQIKEEVSKKMTTSITDILNAVSDTSFMNDLKANTDQEFTKGLDILSLNMTNSETNVNNENDIENITKAEINNIVKNIVNTKIENNSNSYCGSDASGNVKFNAGDIVAKDGGQISIENSASVKNAIKCFTNIQMTNDILNELVNQAGWTVQTDNKTDTETKATSESKQTVTTGWSMGAIGGIIIIVIIIIIGGFLIKKFGLGGSINQRMGYCKNNSSNSYKSSNISTSSLSNISTSTNSLSSLDLPKTPSIKQISARIQKQQDFSEDLNKMFSQQKPLIQQKPQTLKKQKIDGGLLNSLNYFFNLN